MAQYKVLVSALYGLRKKPYVFGDVVSPEDFARERGAQEKRIAELVRGRYIKSLDEAPAPIVEQQKVTETPVEQPVMEVAKDETPEVPAQTEEVKSEETAPEVVDGIDTTIVEIKAELKKLGVTYSKNATKKELYDLFMKASKKSG